MLASWVARSVSTPWCPGCHLQPADVSLYIDRQNAQRLWERSRLSLHPWHSNEHFPDTAWGSTNDDCHCCNICLRTPQLPVPNPCQGQLCPSASHLRRFPGNLWRGQAPHHWRILQRDSLPWCYQHRKDLTLCKEDWSTLRKRTNFIATAYTALMYRKNLNQPVAGPQFGVEIPTTKKPVPCHIMTVGSSPTFASWSSRQACWRRKKMGPQKTSPSGWVEVTDSHGIGVCGVVSQTIVEVDCEKYDTLSN